MNLDRKAILFICPAFFGYEISIRNALIENGYDIDYYDERTSNKSVYKAVFRFRKNLLNNIIDRYYKNIIEQIIKKKYDFFFLIKGEVTPKWFIVEFKKLNPEAKLIYYTYDSFNNNNKHSIYILKHFDKCYSFDFKDVKQNPTLKLKHLFYTAEYGENDNPYQIRKYDMSFVGTLHSNRYQIIKKIAKELDNTYIFFYMPAKWFFWANKLVKKKFWKISKSEVSFDKISKQQVAEIFMCSKSVLDIQRVGQSGLTMRTFEVLASGGMLITTNTFIKEADFYDESKILVISDIEDKTNIDLIKRKIKTQNSQYASINTSFNKYYVNNWVKEFFE